MFKNEVFWKEGFEGEAKGGMFFRSFDLNKFLEKVESGDEEVVVIKFEGNNLELILNDCKRLEV